MKRTHAVAGLLAAALSPSVVPASVAVVAASAVLLPQAARAQGGAASPLAGVALPKGAARQSDRALAAGMGRMMAAGAKIFKLPARAGGPGDAEVYYWSGAAFKPGRAPFLRTMLQSALTEAGYTGYTLVDPRSDTTPNAYDTDAYGTSALNLGFTDGPHLYFHATNVKAGKTIVGVWIDQESQGRTVLAMGEVGFAGGPTETKVPGVSGPDVWLVKNLKNATSGMPPAPNPPFPAMKAKPGTVRGMVKDGSGRPIAGAHLIAWSSAAGGFRTSAEARTNAQGVYEITLPVGVCQIVNADCAVKYSGKTLLLPLHPADGERDQFNSKQGHVENFVLRSGGEYGAPMRVLVWKVPLKSVVEVTLKPNGPLADGGKGRTLVFRFPVRTLSPEIFFGGIPLGRYTLTAKVYDGEDALPLRAKRTFYSANEEDAPEFAPSMPVEFESESTGLASLGRSGIRQFEVTLEP